MAHINKPIEGSPIHLNPPPAQSHFDKDLQEEYWDEVWEFLKDTADIDGYNFRFSTEELMKKFTLIKKA